MSYEVDKAPKRRDGANQAAPWAIYRRGVIGGSGRSLIAKFKSKAQARGLAQKLSGGSITEAEVRLEAKAVLNKET
ncbi:hypothetical protein KUV57_12260 [Epibacterium sp. DP7N7-1]|nr:hypothetical protein [Epibacterium sp. DP7N7-1]